MTALDPILHPKSVAVIGASRRSNTIGWQILDNLLTHDFKGPIYPVNPNASAIHSIRAFASIGEVPQQVDLAVIVVPKEHVLDVARQCAEAGVKGLVVISAGFREIGGGGVERERELAELVRDSGMRMVGPNCMGVINTSATVSMNATFAPSMPPSGSVAFMSQSGAMGLSVLDYAESLGIGISMFVSVGNKVDVSGNDLLSHWADDADTQVILMYLESFGNPSRFIEIAGRITRDKPICVVKSGRTGAGARAAASHTGALAGTDLATDAIISQAGAIRAQTVKELFDLAKVFSNQPLPASNRVAIVTNAGGPGIIIADACEANGLLVTQLAPETEEKLRTRLPEEASVRNPVDLIASATAESYEFALSCVYDDPNVDAAIAAFVPPLGIQTEDVAAALVRVNEQHPEKPLLAVLMGREGLPAGLAELHEAHVPPFVFPESAARALGTMWHYKQRIERPRGKSVEFDTDDDAVASIIDAALADNRPKLSESDSLRVLELYGIPVPRWKFVSALDESSKRISTAALSSAAADAAGAIGFPVALKIVSPEITHKTDVGGVVLDLQSGTELEIAVRKMMVRVSGAPDDATEESEVPNSQAIVPPFPRTEESNDAGNDSAVFDESPAQTDGVLIQQMAPGGTETIVGITRIPRVGPMVMFGMGGIYVEVMRDVVLRLCPLLDSDATEMIHDVKLSKLLEGVRGQPARDIEAISQTIMRASQLACRHPRIAEMDINPLLALKAGALAIDVRIQLQGDAPD
ncbi:MAG: acetate--CoA ligase family protein [Gemmatimonadales bacterium]